MRIRTIKPEFWSHLGVTRLPVEVRLTFIGLWNYADDEGRANADPRLVKAALWPLDDQIGPMDVRLHLETLEAGGFITLYGPQRCYLQIVGWSEHQRISHPKPSKFPAPSEVPPEPSAPDPEEDRNVPHLFTSGREQGTGNREGNGLEAAASPADDPPPNPKPLHPTQPSEDQGYLGELLGLSFAAIQKLNVEYGRPAVTDAMRVLHGFPPQDGVEKPYAYLRTVLSMKAATA